MKPKRDEVYLLEKRLRKAPSHENWLAIAMELDRLRDIDVVDTRQRSGGENPSQDFMITS
jgi:hypothetical protein